MLGEGWKMGLGAKSLVLIHGGGGSHVSESEME